MGSFPSGRACSLGAQAGTAPDNTELYHAETAWWVALVKCNGAQNRWVSRSILEEERERALHALE